MGRDIDGFVTGYAYLLGLEDPRTLWAEALEAWQRQGSAAPRPEMNGPAAAFAEAIRAEALRQRSQDDRERKSKRRASR